MPNQFRFAAVILLKEQLSLTIVKLKFYFKFSRYNTKFGTSAVPIIIVFKQRNVLGQFNYTDKKLDDYIEFIANKTGK